MPNRFLRPLAIASLIPLASCAHYPASPVPAPLKYHEAASLADAYQLEHKSPPMQIMSARRTPEGYLMAYQTMLDISGEPPKESHLFLVHHDGEVRELKFKKNQ